MQDRETSCDSLSAAAETAEANSGVHGNGSSTTTSTGDHGAKFIIVRDSRNRRVPGLYTRNGRFYGRLWVDRGNGKKAPRRFPLINEEKAPVRTLQEAKEAFEIKKHERRENALPTAGRKPAFADYCETYFEKAKVQRKRPGTLENERQAVERWKSWIGRVRVDRITTPMITAFVDKRLKGGAFGGRLLQPVSERTANLDLLMLRNVLKAAMDEGHLRELPKMKALDEAPPPKGVDVAIEVLQLAPVAEGFSKLEMRRGANHVALEEVRGLVENRNPFLDVSAAGRIGEPWHDHIEHDDRAAHETVPAFEAFAIDVAREAGREIVEELDGLVELAADGEDFAMAVPRDALHAVEHEPPAVPLRFHGAVAVEERIEHGLASGRVELRAVDGTAGEGWESVVNHGPGSWG
jgi:hypothetical protein